MKDLVHISTRSARITASAMPLCFARGCTSTGGSFKGQTTGTGVSLTHNNYRILKPGAVGKSYGFRLLGIIPLANPTYARTKADLYESVKEPLTGRAIALANQIEDRSPVYLILFSIPKVTLTADVIEFTDQLADHQAHMQKAKFRNTAVHRLNPDFHS